MYVEETTGRARPFKAVMRVDGKRVSKSFDARWKAEAWLVESRDRLAELRADALGAPTPTQDTPQAAPAPQAPTIVAHGRSWVERRSGRLAPATRSNYTHHLNFLAAEGLGMRPMDQVKRSQVESWQTALVRQGVGKPTINARLKLLRAVYRDAMAEQLVTHDPTQGVALLTTDLKADRVLTAADEAALLLAAPESERLALLLGLDAGLRWSEAFGLAASSVDGDYLVVRQVVERGGALRKYPKGHRARVVPLSARLAQVLPQLAAQARAERGPDALLMPDRNGGAMDYHNWRHRVWTPTVKAAGLDPAPTFHDLRHTFGTRLAQASIPRKEVATLMGHADEATTARYIHAGDDGRRLDMLRKALGA